jgi:8-oxo-dGTP diphosphatase
MFNTATAILVHKNKLLLVLRDDISTITDPNTWNLPGGRIEEGEDFETGCLREIEEEVSITLDALTPIDEFKWPGSDAMHKSYLAKLTDDQALNAKLGNEGQRIGFFSLEELAGLKLSGIIKYQFNNNREELEQILQGR